MCYSSGMVGSTGQQPTKEVSDMATITKVMEYIIGKPNPKKEGQNYADKVILGKCCGATVSISEAWANEGMGFTISGAVALDDLATLVEYIESNTAEAVALWQSRQSAGFVAETAPFVPATPATLSDARLAGAPVGTVGELPGTGRIVVTGDCTYRMATAND